MTSTTTWVSGSLRTSSGLVVSQALSHSGTRSLTMSRTSTLRTTMGAPTRVASAAALADRSRMTPPPTVPQPRRATLMGFWEMTMGTRDDSAPAGKPLPSRAMRAVVLRRLGGPEELEYGEVPDPDLGPGEALVRVKAEGVCGRDLIDRRGGFRGLELPVILGHEFAGEVVEVAPGVVDLAPGDRVANLLRLGCGACRACLRGETPICEKAWQSFGQTRNGGYAELVVAPAAALVKVPAQVSDVEAASVACTFGVALRALRTFGRVTLGDRVLVTGASGGVGMAAIQIAKALGAEVIAATSSESKHEALVKAGADEVVVDPGATIHAKVRERAALGVDVALELTGSPTFTSSMRSLK